jgi:ABC-type Fe3+ transport system substrate-binding protein
MNALRLALTIGLLLTATAGARALTAEEIANLTGPDRQKILEEGARKEGELLWVGSFNEENAKPILEGFAKRYPFIKVSRVRTDSMKAMHRILAEVRARQIRTDLITSSAILELRAAGALQQFRSPVIDAFPPEFKDAERYSAPLYYGHNGLAAFNTSQVKPADAPKGFDDLLDPKWKGQMTFASSSSSAILFVSFLRLTWGEEKARAYLAKLAQQRVAVRNESARTVLGLVASGEYKIMILPTLSHVWELTHKGAPVDAVLMNPIPVNATPVLLAKSAPHPHAAMLLIDYLVDKEAQAMLRDAGYFPGSPFVEPAKELQKYTPKATGFKRLLLDDQKLSEMQPESSALFSKLFE